MAPNIGQKSVFEEQHYGKAQVTIDLLALKCYFIRHFVAVVLIALVFGQQILISCSVCARERLSKF